MMGGAQIAYRLGVGLRKRRSQMTAVRRVIVANAAWAPVIAWRIYIRIRRAGISYKTGPLALTTKRGV
jgi:hypothetical protein